MSSMSSIRATGGLVGGAGAPYSEAVSSVTGLNPPVVTTTAAAHCSQHVQLGLTASRMNPAKGINKGNYNIIIVITSVFYYEVRTSSSQQVALLIFFNELYLQNENYNRKQKCIDRQKCAQSIKTKGSVKKRTE